jgi:hypothetical protein
MDPEDLVSVCTVNNPTEAEMIRNSLKAVGIACEISGENQAGLAGVLSIEVLTHESDAAEARKYLRNLHREKIERKKKRIADRKAKEEVADRSEAIQEKPPSKE